MTDEPRPAEAPTEEGAGPFLWFAIALIIGAAWALFMGLEYYNTPTFSTAAAPTILGVAIAIVAFLIIGARAPANE